MEYNKEVNKKLLFLSAMRQIVFLFAVCTLAIIRSDMTQHSKDVLVSLLLVLRVTEEAFLF